MQLVRAARWRMEVRCEGPPSCWWNFQAPIQGESSCRNTDCTPSGEKIISLDSNYAQKGGRQLLKIAACVRCCIWGDKTNSFGLNLSFCYCWWRQGLSYALISPSPGRYVQWGLLSDSCNEFNKHCLLRAAGGSLGHSESMSTPASICVALLLCSQWVTPNTANKASQMKRRI